MAVRDILEAGAEAGFEARLPPQWTALVVLTEAESGGDPAAVGQHMDKASQYPAGWSISDHARYGGRIALRTPEVTRELVALGIDVAGGAAREGAEALAEPLIEVARVPLRLLTWATDPGTVLRIVKVVGGGALVLAGLIIAAGPAGAKIIPAGKLGKLAKGLKR